MLYIYQRYLPSWLDWFPWCFCLWCMWPINIRYWYYFDPPFHSSHHNSQTASRHHYFRVQFFTFLLLCTIINWKFCKRLPNKWKSHAREPLLFWKWSLPRTKIRCSFLVLFTNYCLPVQLIMLLVKNGNLTISCCWGNHPCRNLSTWEKVQNISTLGERLSDIHHTDIDQIRHWSHFV